MKTVVSRVDGEHGKINIPMLRYSLAIIKNYEFTMQDWVP